MAGRVIIRVDGDDQVGLGHAVRCMALAHMLDDDYEVSFYYMRLPYQLRNEISKEGWLLLQLKDENELLGQCLEGKIVVLDGYRFDTDYQKAIKQAGAWLVCVDDLHDKEFFADLIINHAPGVSPSDYHAQPFTQFALGLDFALLRPLFLSQANERRRELSIIKNVIICFGGSDQNNYTGRVLELLVTFSLWERIFVVTGASNNNLKILNPLLQSDPRIFHFHAISERQMCELMLEAELAIVPSSGVVYEAIACGTIVVSGSCVDNQKSILDGFKKLGVVIDTNNFHPASLREALLECSTHPHIRKVLDGNSKRRIIELFKQFRR